MNAVPTRGPVAVLLKGYPRLSETFIAQEIAGLERAGLDVHLYSMRHPTDRARHPVHDEIAAPVTYLPEYLHREPRRVLRAFVKARQMAGYAVARRQFLADLRRERTRNRVRRFGQAMVLATELPAAIGHIHAHFLHTPSSVADYAGAMSARTWSFSAHAKDIWTTPDWEKAGKLSRAAWGVTCTGAGLDHLRALAPGGHGERLGLVYHGLDLDRFAAPPDRAGGANGSDPARPVVIASVGRAVEKKGYDILLDALARLPAGLAWKFVHIGGGTGLKSLRARARRLGIARHVEWHGARPQGDVIDTLRAADIFVLASRVARDGDRDGLPNVLMEAFSQGLACVASNAAAIPELIASSETGVLVEPENPEALAAAIAALARDPGRREKLGAAAHRRLVEHFSFAVCLAPLLARFGLTGTKRRVRLQAAE